VARIRGIKPDFFLDEELAALPHQARLLFAGLWTQADREGRLEDRPKRLKALLLPYEEADVGALLKMLHPDFILRYNINGRNYIQVRNFLEHQRPHHTEKASTIPEYNGDIPVKKRSSHGEMTAREGVLRRRRGIEKEKQADATAPPAVLHPQYFDQWPEEWTPLADYLKIEPLFAKFQHIVQDLGFWIGQSDRLEDTDLYMLPLLKESVEYWKHKQNYTPVTGRGVKTKVLNAVSFHLGKWEAQQRGKRS